LPLTFKVKEIKKYWSEIIVEIEETNIKNSLKEVY